MFTVEPLRYDASISNECCWGTSSSKSIDVMRPLAPNTLAVDGSMKFALASRAAFGKEKPRSITPLTTPNIVVTPQMPSASTRTASAQNDFSFTRTRSPIRRSRRKVSAIRVTLETVRRAGWRQGSPKRATTPVNQEPVCFV